MFSIRVNITEINQVYKHVHHADILKFLEEARLKFLISLNYPAEYFIDKNQYLVISKIQITYLREVKLEDYKVTVENPRIEGKEIICTQRMINSKNKNAVEANVFSMLLDGNLKRAVNPPEDFRLQFTNN